MKTMEEIQQLMKSLKELYTDVRLLDEETLRKIEEGACGPAVNSAIWNILSRTLHSSSHIIMKLTENRMF